MKLAIISFAREGSKRLPGKNTMLLNGKPLIWYTLQTMKAIKDDFRIRRVYKKNIEIKCYVLTDSVKCKNICKKEGIETIWRDHPKEWDDTRLNQWAHEKINADAYLLLQPTSPYRNKYHILECLYVCINSRLYSAFTVYKTRKLNFKRTGSFFYYVKNILSTGKIYNDSSVILQDWNNIDIDTIEDFKKAEEYAK